MGNATLCVTHQHWCASIPWLGLPIELKRKASIKSCEMCSPVSLSRKVIYLKRSRNVLKQACVCMFLLPLVLFCVGKHGMCDCVGVTVTRLSTHPSLNQATNRADTFPFQKPIFVAMLKGLLELECFLQTGFTYSDFSTMFRLWLLVHDFTHLWRVCLECSTQGVIRMRLHCALMWFCML